MIWRQWRQWQQWQQWQQCHHIIIIIINLHSNFKKWMKVDEGGWRWMKLDESGWKYPRCYMHLWCRFCYNILLVHPPKEPSQKFDIRNLNYVHGSDYNFRFSSKVNCSLGEIYCQSFSQKEVRKFKWSYDMMFTKFPFNNARHKLGDRWILQNF